MLPLVVLPSSDLELQQPNLNFFQYTQHYSSKNPGTTSNCRSVIIIRGLSPSILAPEPANKLKETVEMASIELSSGYVRFPKYMYHYSLVKLISQQDMPLVGFGLWKVDQNTTADTVYHAIKTGYRLFDGAYDYQNEKQAGEGIKKAIADGLAKREDIFVTTKLWNNYHKK